MPRVRPAPRRILGVAALLCALLPFAAAGDESKTTTGPAVRVEILGLQGEAADNVRAGLGLLRHAADPALDADAIRRLYDKAEQEIRRALQPFGLYRPGIESRLLRPPAAGGPWQARFDIDAGPPLPVAELDLRLGAAATALAGVFPLGVGDTLDHRAYKRGKQQLLRRARAAGYLQARLDLHRVEVDAEAYRARIRLHLDPGPLHRFHAIRFEQEGFREDYLRGFVPMRPGDPYTQEAEAELRRALVASGHFRQVAIERRKPGGRDAAEVDLLVRLEPLKPNRYRARLGWGTDTGFGLQFDWTRRNLWHEGHRFNLGLGAVQERAKLVLAADYSIPSDPLFDQRIDVFARHQGKDLSFADVGLNAGDTTRILNNTVGLRLPRPRRLWGGLSLEESLSLTYLTESYDLFDMLFGDFGEFQQEFIASLLGEDREVLAGDYQGLVLGADWVYRDINDPLFARRGDYLRLSLKGAHEALLSNFTFLQTHLRAATIRPLAGGRVILRGEAAYTLASTESVELLGDVEANQIPELYEFRTGGDRTVRGYAYEELLPSKGFTGGKHLWVASLEYDHAVIPDWSVAAFIDAGSAFNRFDDIDAGVGVGAGLRWRSPVGPVRLDLAVPMTEAESPFRIHITIGPEF